MTKLTEDQVKYLNKNAENETIRDMALQLNVPYYKVYKYCRENGIEFKNTRKMKKDEIVGEYFVHEKGWFDL